MAMVEVSLPTTEHCNGGGPANGGYLHDPMQVDSSAICTSSPAMAPSSADPLNWGKAARAMERSHVDEVTGFIETFFNTKCVSLEGVSLTVAHVAAVARRPEVQVVLDAATAKQRVDESSQWVLNKIMRGSDIYGVTTGFGATSHRRTQQGVELQRELIRYQLAYQFRYDSIVTAISSLTPPDSTRTLSKDIMFREIRLPGI